MTNVVYPQPGKIAATLGAALDGLNDEELRTHIAIAAGKLAHREGDQPAFRTLCRIAGALGSTGRQQ